MAQRLQEIISGLDPTGNRFVNSARVEFLRQVIPQASLPAQRVTLTSNLADELVKAGRTEEAITIARGFLDPSPADAPHVPPAASTHAFLALAYLQQGEQENCLDRHRADSCLLPIRRGGVHQVQRGSRAAIKELTTLLEVDPENLGWRWLLNLAYMTVGEYPGGVPERWRVSPQVFVPEHDVGRFIDVAPRAGIAIRAHAGGGIMEDFDGDGLLDLVATSMGVHDQMRFYRNNGDGTFTDRTDESGLTGQLGGLNVVHADYDNDGHPDLFVLRGGWMQTGGYFPNTLLRNRGDGTFEDVTEAAGVLSFRPTQTAAWGDYDDDGHLDLFIGNESTGSDRQPCELYHNDGDGTFTNRSVNLGATDFGYVKGVAWGDFTNNGRQDLYVSIAGGDNLLFRNDGRTASPGQAGADWRFTNVSRQAGISEPEHSLPVWFWDFDNDGWLDIFVAGFEITDLADLAALHLGQPARTEVPRLYRNNRDGTFTDVTRAARLDRVALTMGSNFGDLDNDGYPDCYLGTGEPSLGALIPNRLFRNVGGEYFQDVTTSANVGHLQKGHGVAFGDIDNDGDQDIFEEMGGFYEVDESYSVLFLNPGHGHHWITLRLEGRRSNRSAIGTRIRVRVRTPDGGRDIHATVGAGGSFGGNSLQQEIGLGNAQAIEVLEITWPATGRTQVFRDVALDRVYHIVEDESQLTPVEVSPITMG